MKLRSSPAVALVVDDEPLIRALVANVLERVGFRVLCAADAATARRVCSRTTLPLDIVVSDIHLPDGSGLAIARELAVQRRHVPVLFMSGGYVEGDPILLSHLRQGRAFLEKPFTERALTTKIAALFRAAVEPRLDLQHDAARRQAAGAL